MSPKRVGWIGLGAMGQPMARRLLDAGFELSVCAHHNRAPLEALVALGARGLDDPAALASACEVVVTMVPDAPQVEDACFGPRGLLAGHVPGQNLTLVDMSTISPESTRAIARRLAAQGVTMLDAPVSGGPARAASGELTVMVGGEADLLARHRDVLEALGNRIVHVGPTGHGTVAKLANNMIIGSLMPAIAEALTLAAKAGADVGVVRDVILSSSGGNYLLEHWLPGNLLQDQYAGGFALELMHKDLGAALGAGRALGVPLMLSALSQQLYAQAMGLGYGREDYSAVSKIYQDAAHVTIATGAPRP